MSEKPNATDGLGKPYEIDEINLKGRYVVLVVDAGMLGSLGKNCIQCPEDRKLQASIQSLGHNLLNAGDVLFGKTPVENRHPALADVLIVGEDGNDIAKADANAA